LLTLQEKAEKEYQKIGLLCHEHRQTIGGELSLPKTVEKTFFEILSKVEGHIFTQENNRELLVQVKETLEKQKNLGIQVSNREKDIQGLEAENALVYGLIGENCFQSYSNSPEKYQHYSGYFKEIVDLTDKLLKTSGGLEEETEQINPLQKFIRKGMAVADQMKKNGLQKRVRSEYAVLGKELVKTDYLNEAKNPQLIEVASPVLRNVEKQQELREEIGNLQGEIREILTFLGSMREQTKSQNSEKTVQNLEMRLEFSEKEATQSLISLGKVAMESAKLKNDPEIGAYYSQLKEIEEEIQETRTLIDKHKGAIEVKDITRSLAGLEKDANHLEQVIQSKKNELERVKKETLRQQKLLSEAQLRAGDFI